MRDTSRIATVLRFLSSSSLPSPEDFPSWAYEDRDFFRFEILHRSRKAGSHARVGRIHTPHGVVDTPGFVAVATNGALKGLDFAEADADDGGRQQLVFCNTYHLLLQPGSEVVRDAGGLHAFAARERNRPFITDSGGFQVFSLAYGSVREELASKGELKRQRVRNNDDNKTGGGYVDPENDPHRSSMADAVRVTEDGVDFRSYRDGSRFLLTPESTVRAQKDLGADIIIPLDELPPFHISRDKLVESLRRSHRWEARSLTEHLKDVRKQAMYCVVHGGLDVDLRTESATYLTSLPFDGYAVGGSLGGNRDDLNELLGWMTPRLFDGPDTDPRVRDKPRHLLGIADEENVRRTAVPYGMDTMDSCYPTRLARHGTLLTNGGRINVSQGKYARQYGVPIDETCDCPTCRRYDRAYLNHLFRAKEPLAIQLAMVHNIRYMNDMMAGIRRDILEDRV